MSPRRTLRAHCTQWFAHKYPQHAGLLFALPNSQSLLAIPRYFPHYIGNNLWVHGLFIAFDLPNLRQSPSRKRCESLVDAAGYQYRTVTSLAEFQAQVLEHIRTAPIHRQGP